MNEIDKIVRRTVSSIIDDVVNYIVSGTAKSLEKIRCFLPNYKLILFTQRMVSGYTKETVSLRYFVPLNANKKGKKRVYISQAQGKKDLFIFFLSKSALHKMKSDLDDFALKMIEDHWVITEGRYEFESTYQLFGSLIAIERPLTSKPSYANHPPTGKRDYWCAAGTLSEDVFNYSRSTKLHSEVSAAFLTKYSIEEARKHVQ